MDTANFKTLLDFTRHFHSEEVCRDHLADLRWGGSHNATCPHCGHAETTKLRGDSGYYKCKQKECRKRFNELTGTVFQGTRIPLDKWFAALYLISNHKKGISSVQLASHLGLTQPTAWFLIHRVRELLRESSPQLLVGEVQVDETYVGGKNKNRHRKQRELMEGRGWTGKTTVFGALSKQGGVIARVVDGNDGVVLKPVVRQLVGPGSTLVSDGHGAYHGLQGEYEHVVVKQDGEYTVGPYHTNAIEGFWSQLKRGLIGVYHAVSRKHLQRYCDEFAYRYNQRELSDRERFEAVLGRMERRLSLKGLTE